MNPRTIDRANELLQQLPGSLPVQAAAWHLLSGYGEHVRATHRYHADGRVSDARRAELLDQLGRRLLAQLGRLADQVAKGGAA